MPAMRNSSWLTWFVLCWVSTTAWGQSPYTEVRTNWRKIDIPFEFVSNFIILDVTFQKSFPVKFIFDTGAEHTILTKRELTDIFGFPFQRTFTIVGSDMTTELTAYLVRGVQLGLKNLQVRNYSLLVLEDDYFHFEELTGEKVYGILGADFFKGYIVKIDYSRKLITLFEPKLFKPPFEEDYIEIPVELRKNKPYFTVQADLAADRTTSDIKLLLDTGASLSLLLHTNTHPDFNLPPNVIRGQLGMGLGGYLEGYLGRVSKVELGPFDFTGVLTNFQELPPNIDSTMLNNRNGIIGNEILSRFTVIIDYIKGRLYLKPNRHYNDKFQYDRSGLVIIAAGATLSDFNILEVIEGSPAHEAGLLPKDEIKAINGLPAGLYSLNSLTGILQKKSGKKIKMVVKRGEEKIKVTFHLRDII